MRHLVFVLMPGFSAMAFFSALEPMRVANRLARRELFAWTILAPDHDHAQASNGMLLRAEQALPPRLDTLIVCAGFDPLARANPSLLGQIRRLWRSGCRIGAIDTGAFILAEAGILGRDPVTLHWEAAEEFRHRHPQIPVSDELYERHDRLFTCAGGTAAMDMMLDAIASEHGIDLAGAVSDQLIHDRIRPASTPQRMSEGSRMTGLSSTVRGLIEAMERGIGQARPLEAILAGQGLTRRTAERILLRETGMAPGRFYRELRVRHALELARNARIPLHRAALAAGFSSSAVFSRACRQLLGKTPRELVAEGALT